MAFVLPTAVQSVLDFVVENQAFFWWLGIGTMVCSVVGILLVPWVVGGLSEDYFVAKAKVLDDGRSTRDRSIVLILARNVAGLVLLSMGIVMLFVPGQGLLTMFVGLLLLSFPGKQRLVLTLVRRPAILGALNWMRRYRGKVKFKQP